MDNEYKCPQCGSTNMDVGCTVARCLSCGYFENLIDYPVSWNTHRVLSIRDGFNDPGGGYSDKQDGLEELSARVTFLEEVDQPIDRHLRSDVQQLKAANLYLQKQVKELQATKKKNPPLYIPPYKEKIRSKRTYKYV